LARLADLGIKVKVITGDNAIVATKLCADLGLTAGAALTGADVDRLDDQALTAAIETTTVFARVSPGQKARIVRVRRNADGVVEGRRIFANTIKYVLMGTSSNFGNMFSAAGASVILPFLPMLPSQILLNNFVTFGIMAWGFHAGPVLFRSGWFVE
jgi:Mg2+-importing ATPase